MLNTLIKQVDAPPSCLALTVNKHPFCCHSATFFIMLFICDFSKIAPKHSAEVLCSTHGAVPYRENACVK